MYVSGFTQEKVQPETDFKFYPAIYSNLPKNVIYPYPETREIVSFHEKKLRIFINYKSLFARLISVIRWCVMVCEIERRRFDAENLMYNMISPEIFLKTLYSSPVPIAVFALSDKCYYCQFANSAYHDVLGVHDGDLVNKAVSDIFLAANIHLKEGVFPDLADSFEKTAFSGISDVVKNIELTVHMEDRAVPKIFYCDIEHTALTEDGKVSYVSQSLLLRHTPSEFYMEDSGNGTEKRDRAELIETILQNLPIGIAVNRIDTGEATLVNHQFSETYGWSERDLVDIKSFFEKVYPEPQYREEILRTVMDDINSGEEARMEWQNIEVTTAKGEKRIVNAKNIPLPHQNLMISTVVDITLQARQAAEIRRAKVNQEALVNSSEDLIWSVDTDLRIITANKAFLSNLKQATGKDLQEGDYVQDDFFGEETNHKWKAYYDRALNGESFTVKEKYFSPSRNGIEYSVVSFSPMRNGQGQIFGSACYSKDITNDTLAELEKNLLISNTEESFVLLNKDLQIVSFNDQFKQLYQIYFDKIVEKGESILDYAQPERRSIVADIYERVFRGESHVSELAMTNPLSGEKTVFSIKYKPAKNSEDEVIGAFVTAIDITERQQVLDKLTESEERYKLLFQSSPLPNFVYDLSTFQILDVNDTATEHYGYSRSEFLAKTILDITAAHERNRVAELHKHIQLAGQGINLGIVIQLKKNGGLIQSDIFGYKINFGGSDCLMISCNDVTEREKAYHRLKENESKLLASQKIAKVGYWQSFPGSKGLYWSDEVYNIWGLDKQTFNLDFDSHFNTIHPDDRKEFLRSRDKALKEDIQHDIEHRIILPDGSIKWVHALGNLIKSKEGEIVVFEGTVQDITKDKLAQEELLVSEARHRGIFESQTNYMIRTDLEGNYSFLNNKFQQDFGWLYEGKEIIGQNCMSSILDYHRERVSDTVTKCFAELNKVFQVFIDKPRRDGNGVVNTLWDFICLTDSKGQPSELQCVGIDVSEWKRTQEELEESNARYEYITRATSDAIWDWDLRTDEVYYGGGFQTLFGHPIETNKNHSTFWKELLHPEDIQAVLDKIESVINGHSETWTVEYRFRKSNGKYAFVLDKGILIKDKSGTPIKLVGAMQDISEGKIAEKQKQLHAETSRLFNQPDASLNEILGQVLEHILNYGDIAVAEIWLPSSDKRQINLTSRCTKDRQFDLFYEAESELNIFVRGAGLPGKVWESREVESWDNIDTESKFIRHIAAKRAALKTAVGLPLVYNDEFIGVLILFHQEKGESLLENVAFRTGFCQHLSSEIKRKQLDQELKQIFSFAPDVISVAGTDGYFKKINPAACEMLEYSEEELLSKPVSDFVHPDDRIMTWQFVRNLVTLSDTYYHENRYITKSGKVIWLAWTSTPSPEEGLMFAVAKNITEKKNLEVLLEKSNSLAEIGSWEINIQNNSIYWSSVTRQIHEVDADFTPDMETGIGFYAEGFSRDSVRNAVEQSLNYGTPWDMELQIITAKGNKRWVRAIGESEFVNGKCLKLYGSFQNITNRKVAEIELLKIYDEKNTILESIQDGFYALDKNWTVTYWNHEAENLLLLKRSEVLNRSLWEVFEEAVDLKFYSEYHRAVDNNVPVRFEEYFPPLDSWFEVSAFPSEDGLTVYFRDVTSRKKVELELLQFKEVIDNSRDGIAIVDLEGKITYLNPAFSGAIGFDPVIHDHPESIYANRQLVGQVFDTLLTGKYWQGDVEIKTQAGELISYYLSGGPVFDEDGQLKAVYGIHTDITERKQAEQKIRKAYYERNTILESIGDGFFAVDKNWTVNYWNKEAEKLLGITRKQSLGNDLWKVFDHMTESASYLKYQEAIETNEVIHFEDYYPAMHKWYEVSAYPSVDGLSVFFKDITERKIYDIQVRELNRVLRTKVKELAVSNKELEQFAYVASHDLQEPLRMITSFLTQLQRKYDDKLDAKAHQYIHFAVDGAKRMRQIILDLLDFSRVGRADSEIELVDLNEIINEILILFRKNIEDKKALFVISDLPFINAPKASIRQLLQNLVSNALKYQLPETKPLVEIGFTEKPEYWEFWVKDNGIGISPDYFEKIFIIFQRLHTKDQYSGTGMGLAICRKIVENLGGKLWVESEEGRGSIFYFTVSKASINMKEIPK